ncbi:MAG: indole-3-glycerol phosphate synthase TrpC [bacterium]|nr:indole-3-glycerol phosphate synthase TrpC [bacterium]
MSTASGAPSAGSAASLLDRIVAQKELEIQSLQPAQPPASAQPFRFEQALKRPPGEALRVIAECKKASPSMGLIRADYRPGEIARSYRDCGANALSVLTDREFFQGDLGHLGAASESSGLPVLRKDFTISPLQIQEARAAGADAILLIVRLLSPSQLSELQDCARELGMTALVEIHSAAEAEAAVDCGASLIGINHRDLDTLEMDLSLTERIAPELRKARPDAVLLAESGVENRAGRERVDPHVDGILIGTALMQSSDIPTKWAEIFS